MRKIALMFIFSLILFSCEKDKQLIIENTDIPLISKILDDGEVTREYSYNEANLVTEEKSKFTYTSHTYNDANILVKSEFYLDPAMFSSSSTVIEAAMQRTEWVNPENTEKSLTQTFNYDGEGQLSRKTYTRPSVSHSEYSEFTWENDRISRSTMYWQDQISGYVDYFYDEYGNLFKEIKYMIPSSTGIAELVTTTEYEFDNKLNPYRAFRRLMTPGKFTNMNNITKERYITHIEVPSYLDTISVIAFTYEYNDMDYPVKVNGETEYIYR
jgi:hypothetical protein